MNDYEYNYPEKLFNDMKENNEIYYVQIPQDGIYGPMNLDEAMTLYGISFLLGDGPTLTCTIIDKDGDYYAY